MGFGGFFRRSGIRGKFLYVPFLYLSFWRLKEASVAGTGERETIGGGGSGEVLAGALALEKERGGQNKSTVRALIQKPLRLGVLKFL